MYNGNHAAPRRRRNSKALVLVLSLILVICVAAAGTIAWLVTQTDPVVNTFTAGTGGTVIEEVTTPTTKNEIVVQNTGNVDAYVRVSILINRVDANGNVLPSENIPNVSYDTTKWFLHTDGYYYYIGTVPAGGRTENMLTSPITLDDGEGTYYAVDVMAQTIQVGGGAVEDAWHMTYNNGWAAAPVA